MARATLSHSLHDLGLAAWFGGTLANAVALNKAAAAAGDAHDAGAVANAGWDRWTPVNAAAIGAHLVGAVGLLNHDRGRMQSQEGVMGMAVAKTALTVAALGLTAYSRVAGRKVSETTAVPVADGTTPTSSTPSDVSAAQKQLTQLQWAIPAVTGAIVAISAYASEQTRPEEFNKGVVKRILH